MKENCAVCGRSFENENGSVCSTCKSAICPECSAVYESKCRQCYFDGKLNMYAKSQLR